MSRPDRHPPRGRTTVPLPSRPLWAWDRTLSTSPPCVEARPPPCPTGPASSPRSSAKRARWAEPSPFDSLLRATAQSPRLSVPMDQTLVLNASYEPLRVVSWQKAITLLFQGKVEVIAVYDREIRGVTVRVRLPSVLRLLRHVRMKRSFCRRAVLPGERLRPRRSPLPVLRPAFPACPAHLRPRPPRGPRWAQGLEQHRHLLHRLQPPEGRSPSRGSGPSIAEATATSPGPAPPDPEPGTPEGPRELARLSLLGSVLGRRVEAPLSPSREP